MTGLPPPADSEPLETGDPFTGPDWDESRVRSSTQRAGDRPTKRLRIRISRSRRRRRRHVAIAMVIAGGVILLGGVWLVVTGLLARNQLTHVRAEVHQLRAEISAGNLTAARATADVLAKNAHRAHQLTTGPVWALVANLPAGGQPLRTIRGITASLDSLGHSALPPLVSASEQMDPTKLRRPDGSIDLAIPRSAAPALDRAAATIAAVYQSVSQLPSATWLPTIDQARRDVLTQVVALDHTIRSADVAVRIAPSMLGAEHPKRYFVAFQNESEARGTGGLPGAFAILVADHGKLKFTHFESDLALRIVPTGLDFGPDYRRLYEGAQTTSKYVNTNLSPNFPYAARIWSAMWQKQSGEHIDGAMAVDPSLLSYLLAVTGPVTLPDKSTVSSGNVVALTQSTVYARFPSLGQRDQVARKNFLLEVARVSSSKILAAHVSTTALLRAAGRAAAERRLLIWSADPAVQAALEQTSVSGAIPSTSAPYVGLSIVNDGGNKLDYYLDRSLTWQRTGCGSIRQSTVTITLRNDVPAGHLSPFLTARSDQHPYPVKPGDNRLEVSYLATTGALMRSVTVAGKPGTAGVGFEHGHPVYTVDLELPRGTSRTIVLHLSEPAGRGDPIVLRQPLVRPLHVTLDNAGCS